MSFDIRYPLGLMFAVIGAIVGGYGLATRGSDLYRRSLGMNVNAAWGAVMLLFGLVLVLSARAARRRR